MSASSAEKLEVGQAVQVRGRLAVVQDVIPVDPASLSAVRNIADLEYLDGLQPSHETVLWELELGTRVLEDVQFPDPMNVLPGQPDELRAFVNAHRWTRLQRVADQGSNKPQFFASIPSASLQVHPYQLVPLLRSLRMPRVNLLLADGVGLGKTIEAGLVLQELLLRRRARRILIVCPAMLQQQWQDELQRKFRLQFEIMDSERAFQIRRTMGIDTNPWRAQSRWIVSMDYLRQPDIRSQFKTASKPTSSSGFASPSAPWDLLIVDEAHNAAPTGPSRSSQRYDMLREIRFLFEHRVFLTATPHNGRTVSYTGLLELLDPVRFQMKTVWESEDRRNLDSVKVRRLKVDLDSYRIGSPIPMPDNFDAKEVLLPLTDNEIQLYRDMRDYRLRGLERLNQIASDKESWVAQFVFQILTKRLLSCPYAFARTWWRHVDQMEPNGEASDEALDRAGQAARRAEKADQDTERSTAEEDAARHGGTWLLTKIDDRLQSLRKEVSETLEIIGLGYGEVFGTAEDVDVPHHRDRKTESLIQWIQDHMTQSDGDFRGDERLIVFTEYRETLIWLQQQFARIGWGEDRVDTIVGGMDRAEFERVKSNFEDETSRVRILLATDAASEGINLQQQCRWVFHFDIPWSPTKLQQRNGRVWRHGQPRDVEVFYFRSDEAEDLQFLFRVAKKVETVRDELGSVETIFDEALHEHFHGRDADWMESRVDRARDESSVRDQLPADSRHEGDREASEAFSAQQSTDRLLGVTPDSLRQAVHTAMNLDGGGAIEPVSTSANGNRYKITIPRRWQPAIGESLSINNKGDRPFYLFDPNAAMRPNPFDPSKTVFRLNRNEELVRLGHPLAYQALVTLKRQLYEDTAAAMAQGRPVLSRWSVGGHNLGTEASYLIVHAVVLAQNALRDPIHDETFSRVFQVFDDTLESADNVTTRDLLAHPLQSPSGKAASWTTDIRKLWLHHRRQLEAWLVAERDKRRDEILAGADSTLTRLLDVEGRLYKERLAALTKSRDRKTLTKLVEARRKLEREARQARFDFDDDGPVTDVQLADLEAEIETLQRDLDDLQTNLETEREYRLKTLLPSRYSIQDRDVHVFPLAIEYALPLGGAR